MEKIKKEKITLSLPAETRTDLDELSKKYGMTKSGLIHFLLQRLKERGDLFK
jgi:predicted DNA-binding protein